MEYAAANQVIKMIAMEPVNTTPTTFPKNVALSTAFSGQELTLRKQKALHAIVVTVREKFFLRNPHFDSMNIHTCTEQQIASTNNVFEVDEEEVMGVMGYTDRTKYFSFTQVLGLFEDLADETLGFDGLGIVRSTSERESWTGFTKLLASVERVNGKFVFEIPKKIIHRIVNPEISFNGPVSFEAYSSKHTPGIYETCLYYHQRGMKFTDWISLLDLRKITGSTSSTYEDFNKFKKRVLEKTINTINDTPKLNLHLTFETDSKDVKKAVGRNKITHIRFGITEKINSLAKPAAITGITFSVIKDELCAMGIPANQIEGVIEDCSFQDQPTSLQLEYLKWCIRRGNELRLMTPFRTVLDDGQPNPFNFGGYFRKHVIRGKKESWRQVNDLVTSYLIQTEQYNKSQISGLIGKTKLACKRLIAYHYIHAQSELSRTRCKEKFENFLTSQLHTQEHYETSGRSLDDLALDGDFSLMLFLDYEVGLFSIDAFKETLPSLKSGHLEEWNCLDCL